MQTLSEEILGEHFQETIQSGDGIEYYHPLFVAGDPHALRTGFVTAVCPSNDLPLVISNGDLLPKDIKVKRVKTVERGVIVDCVNGCYRPVENYALKEGGLPTAITEAQQFEGDRLQVGCTGERGCLKMWGSGLKLLGILPL